MDVSLCLGPLRDPVSAEYDGDDKAGCPMVSFGREREREKNRDSQTEAETEKKQTDRQRI